MVLGGLLLAVGFAMAHAHLSPWLAALQWVSVVGAVLTLQLGPLNQMADA